jgi:hypothetical protein
VLLTLTGHIFEIHLTGEDAEMTGDVASKTEPSMPTGQRVLPTGYRVSLLEVGARLGTPEEVRNLVKILRAAIAILEDTAEDDFEEPLRLKINAASKVVASRK